MKNRIVIGFSFQMISSCSTGATMSFIMNGQNMLKVKEMVGFSGSTDKKRHIQKYSDANLKCITVLLFLMFLKLVFRLWRNETNNLLNNKLQKAHKTCNTLIIIEILLNL